MLRIERPCGSPRVSAAAHEQRLPEYVAALPVEPALPAPLRALLLRLQRPRRIDLFARMLAAVVGKAEIRKRELGGHARFPLVAERQFAA